jgi:hypothetical protein
MRTAKIVGMIVAVVSLLEFGLSWAAESQKTLQLVVKIIPRASLSLDQTQITFVGYEDQKIIPSQEGPMTVMAKGRANLMNPLTLTISANSDLEGSQGRIPIQQVQWTYQGQNSKSRALSRGDQVVGFWNKSGEHRGELQFVLKNNGSLAPGDYAGSVTLTLSSP